ncbi:MAG: hypothetical protein IKZ55_02905 [Bacteroidales bacterium]|nr:hypothetical protein [Bacteroidales bacterium]
MFTVKVVESCSGRPVSGAKVSVYVNNGLSHFGFTNDQYTDYDGEASFGVDSNDATIYVNGQSKYRGRVEGIKIIYV